MMNSKNSSFDNDAALALKKEGDSYIQTENYQQAITYYRQALNISPQFIDALVALGFALHEIGSIDEAAQYLHKVLSITPDNIDAHFMLGNICIKKAQHQQAIEHYMAAININPKFNFAYRALFDVYQALGDLTQAKSILERAMAELPASTTFIFERAGLYFAEKDFQNAVLLLQRILKISPNNIGCHLNLVNIYKQLGQETAAIPYLEKLVKIKPDDAAVYEDLATAYLKLERKQDALACFKEVVRIEPNSPIQHLVAAFSGVTTTTAPVGYVQKLFDLYAENFESHLTQTLHYNTPFKLASLIQSCVDLSSQKLDVLDLGCGTGLFGKEITSFAAQLVGVDLSLKMLEKAAQLNIYHRLEHQELIEMMRKEPDASYDLIVATDVFIYVGALDEVVLEAKRLLRPNGIFAFSIEALDAVQHFVLNDTGRYSHSIAYLKHLEKMSGFRVITNRKETIREDEGKAITGYLSLWLVDDTSKNES
ncbi:MAG: tetratricopeptide repeat protein [Moraxellaceae bacterium]|nr:tetratricopeptide repeat protein [Moraxellaceae bacterium]